MRGGVAPPPADAPSKPGRALNSAPSFLTSRMLPSPSPPGLLSTVGDPRTFTAALPRPASPGSPRRLCNDARPSGMGGSNALFEGVSSALELVSATRESPGEAGTGGAATSPAIAAGTCLERCVLLGRRCPLLATPGVGRIKAF